MYSPRGGIKRLRTKKIENLKLLIFYYELPSGHMTRNSFLLLFPSAHNGRLSRIQLLLYLHSIVFSLLFYIQLSYKIT